MSDDETIRQVAPTRRDAIKYGSALVGSGLVAGCVSDGSTGTPDDETPNTDDGHSVTMEPMGTVEFDSVPEQWVPYTGDYADMGVALGQADGLEAIGIRARFGTHYYEELPGVAVDEEALTQLWNDGTDKEVFYELDSDVNVVDPNFMINRLGLSEADVEEIRENIAPLVGNTGFTRVYDWHDDYRYYS
ncbi:MAG: Fe3+-hydroxamate ABC transporter substrate-binding protein, partial [Natronomonas sp.]